MSDYEFYKKRLAELEKLLNEKEKLNAELEGNEVKQISWNEILGPLQSNFPEKWKGFVMTLRDLFLKNPHDTFVRWALQIALLGIVWTETSNIPEILRRVRNIAEFQLSETSIDITARPNDIWKQMDAESRIEIISYVERFRASPNAKAEAQISSNLWGLILRKMLISIEKLYGDDSQDDESIIHLFPEFRMQTIEAVGAQYYSDFAATAGCKGLPLILYELESKGIRAIVSHRTSGKEQFHKDLKKLSVEMSGVLLQIIGAIRTSKIEGLDIQKLRSFGSLISDTKIQFYVCRPVTFTNGKFVLIMETHPKIWKLDLFENDQHGTEQDQEMGKHKESKFLLEKESEFSNVIVDNDIVESTYLFEKTVPVSGEESHKSSSDSDYSKPIGRVDENTLEVLANFLGQVYTYYRSLDATLKQIYADPGKFKGDPQLKYPKEVHSAYSTSSVSFPPSKQEQFLNDAKHVPYYDACVEHDIPMQFIFTTLPSILHVKNSEIVPNRKFIRYVDGINLQSVENSINKNTDTMESDRVYYRSVLILDILMGIYMAARAGIGFHLFTLDEITFRNGLFCVKTYSHSKPISSEFSILDSINQFQSFYCRNYFMSHIMTEGDPKYAHLVNIEGIVFGGLCRLDSVPSEQDWRNLFQNAKAEFELILDDRFSFYQRDSTWFLLDNLITELKSSIDSSLIQTAFNKQSLASSGSSSIETMNIVEKNNPTGKLTESIINEDEEEETPKNIITSI